MTTFLRDRIRHFLYQRHLLREFLRRDLQARYIGSTMGFFWSVVNPLILLLVYSVVFGAILQPPQLERLAERGWEGGALGFAFYIFCGLLPWYAFQESLARNTSCIVENANLIKQVRFPAKVLPVYLTLSSLVNQVIGTAIFLVFQLVILGGMSLTAAAFPILLGLQFIFFFGLGLLFSTLHTYFRDVGPMISIITMIMMWAAPMLYSIDFAPDWLLPVLYANPITYLLLLHHDLMLYGVWPPAWLWSVFGGIALGSLAVGYTLFTRCHGEFADLL
jgi:lipopolysaccharide transport system permease protein